MKKSLVFVLTLILTALVGITSTDAKSVSSPKAAVKRGGMCFPAEDPLWTTFTCDYIGKVTVKQIYENGFRVAFTMHYGSSLAFIIEEQ